MSKNLESFPGREPPSLPGRLPEQRQCLQLKQEFLASRDHVSHLVSSLLGKTEPAQWAPELLTDNLEPWW